MLVRAGPCRLRQLMLAQFNWLSHHWADLMAAQMYRYDNPSA